MQDSERQADHLQILATSGGGDVPGLRPDVEEDAALQPWYQEMCALVDDALLNSLQTIEYNGSCSTPHVVNARLHNAGADDGGNGEPCHCPDNWIHNLLWFLNTAPRKLEYGFLGAWTFSSSAKCA